jgi:hypothetical protein
MRRTTWSFMAITSAFSACQHPSSSNSIEPYNRRTSQQPRTYLLAAKNEQIIAGFGWRLTWECCASV